MWLTAGILLKQEVRWSLIDQYLSTNNQVKVL